MDWIAGVDEAGRGPLAGPVYAAAVILHKDRPIEGVNDSKKFTSAQREALFDRIYGNALSVAYATATVEEIDRLNILRATLLAMKRAVDKLSVTPHKILVDGSFVPEVTMEAQAIIKGDQTVQSISAASIVAKVLRDREMVRLAEAYPKYGFEKHKGYGTRDHLVALRQYGPCEVHRHSFAPVRAAAKLEEVVL